ncbi:hypothetical protein D3C76_1822640 [compost metagenome]
MLDRLLRVAAHRHVIHQHPELAFKIDALALARQSNVVARADEIVTGALIHERRVFYAVDGLKIERLLHQGTVAEEG